MIASEFKVRARHDFGPIVSEPRGLVHVDSARNVAERSEAYREATAVTLARFIDSIYRMAEREYRRHHRRLPGSERTARLRKKRRKRVLDWFADYLND